MMVKGQAQHDAMAKSTPDFDDDKKARMEYIG